jgi:hypothetical protein
MFDAIGGYFELELLACKGQYHDKAERLNTARNCLEYIVLARSPKRFYVPYYTCDVLMDVLNRHSLDIIHYHIDEAFEPERQYELKDGDLFLYINYFGLMAKTASALASIYNTKLVVDNSQAFYCAPIVGVDTFYSARKFFGVADGAYLYTSNKIDIELEQDVSYLRMAHLLKRIDVSAEAGYMDYSENEDLLRGERLKRMSKLTERILGSVNYERAREKRGVNFSFLESQLSGGNGFHFAKADDDVPMVYPYLCSRKPDRDKLLHARIYTSQYWQSVVQQREASDFERNIVENTIFCPIDQRYDESTLRIIASEVRSL